jgi:F0F1-type ATP synthase delta subunit
MKQPRHHLAQAIADKTLHLSGVEMKTLAKEIAAYLLQEGQVSDLEPLMRDVIAARAEKGLVEAEATSAHELSKADRDDIEEILKVHYPNASQLKVDYKIDPGVVGGVKLSMPNQQLDESVRTQISKFKYLTSERI